MTTTKAEVLKLIESSAEKIQQHGETREQAYVRFITKTDEGRALHSVYKRAPGPDHSPPEAPIQKCAAPTPAMAKLLQKAEAIKKAEANITMEQAFAKTYLDPNNRDLVELEKRQRLTAAA